MLYSFALFSLNNLKNIEMEVLTLAGVKNEKYVSSFVKKFPFGRIYRFSHFRSFFAKYFF